MIPNSFGQLVRFWEAELLDRYSYISGNFFSFLKSFFPINYFAYLCKVGIFLPQFGAVSSLGILFALFVFSDSFSIELHFLFR